MQISNFRAEFFQAFSDTGNITLGDGINLIVGQNNVGKSSLLRAFLPDAPMDKNRSAEEWLDFRLPSPRITFTINFSLREFKDCLLERQQQAHFPVPYDDESMARTFYEEVLRRDKISITFTRENGGIYPHYPSHSLFVPEDGLAHFIRINPGNGGLKYGGFVDEHSDNLGDYAFFGYSRRSFYIAAERMALGTGPLQRAEKLSRNADNLSAVLSTIAGERTGLFQTLKDLMCTIFPNICDITVRPTDNGFFEIRVWPTENRDRVEYSFPLSSSGTGIGQVLTILTAVLTCDKTVMLIDEINSFLHPAAVKSLLRILQTDFKDHQYIITTHSPDAIGFSNPHSIYLITRTGFDSRVRELDVRRVDSFREIAQHLGVSVSDVFASNKIIWVEGQTEELCFPSLYRKIYGNLPRGTIFSSVCATGDFLGKKRERKLIYEIYRRLSESVHTLDISVLFSFDSELLSDDEKAEMQRGAENRIHFLPRRNFECFLLDSDAIVSFISKRDSGSKKIDAGEVSTAIIHLINSSGQKYQKSWAGDINDENWLKSVDAASLIKETCEFLTNARVTFNKCADSLELLNYIIENKKHIIEKLAIYVKSLVDLV